MRCRRRRCYTLPVSPTTTMLRFMQSGATADAAQVSIALVYMCIVTELLLCATYTRRPVATSVLFYVFVGVYRVLSQPRI